MNKVKLDVYVVSWGGVGTTALINLIKNNKLSVNCKNDIDNIKHINHPNDIRLKKYNIKKCIFIYDDCIKSLISLFRRKIHCEQVIKISKNKIPSNWDVNNYAKNNKDLFEFGNFYNNWTETNKTFPCLYIKLSEIDKYKKQILHYLGLSPSTNFIKYSDRNSDKIKDKLFKNTQDVLNNMYKEFNDLILSNPGLLYQKENTKLLTEYTFK